MAIAYFVGSLKDCERITRGVLSAHGDENVSATVWTAHLCSNGRWCCGGMGMVGKNGNELIREFACLDWQGFNHIPQKRG